MYFGLDVVLNDNTTYPRNKYINGNYTMGADELVTFRIKSMFTYIYCNFSHKNQNQYGY